MTKNPFINALAGSCYITLVASLMFYSSEFEGTEPSVIIPIAVLSLFVFSAAVMGFLFLKTPLELFLENKKRESIELFWKTLASFAGITLLLLATWMLLQ